MMVLTKQRQHLIVLGFISCLFDGFERHHICMIPFQFLIRNPLFQVSDTKQHKFLLGNKSFDFLYRLNIHSVEVKEFKTIEFN